MSAVKAWISTRRLYWSVLAPTLVMACIVAALAAVSVKVLGSIRGYGTGESAWSKSCSNALTHLSHYALSRDLADFDRFEAALEAPLGSRRAREELNKPDPDTALIHRLFVAGGSHPDDIPGMIILFRHFGSMPLFQRTIAAWIDGDRLIDQLRLLGQQIRTQVEQHADDRAMADSLVKLRELNQQFNQTEQRFRLHLDEAGRLTEVMLIAAILLSATALTAGSLALVRRTLRKQVRHERALAAATRRWELAAQIAGLGLFERATRHDRITLDDKAAQMYGMGPGACVTTQQELDRCLLEADRQKTEAALQRATETGQTVRDIHRVVLPDGQTRDIELIGRQEIYTHRGEPNLVGVVRDITDELRQAQSAMQRDAAEQVAAAQREFLSRLSHELRTPLNAILGFAQLMQLDQANATATQNRQVGMILGAGKQLLSLVEDVLDLSKVESGHIHMHLDAVDAHAAIHACVPLLDSHLSKDNLRLQLELSDGPLWVHADLQRLHQVLINLLTNACKYNRAGGLIRVRTYRSSAHPTHVCIDICDTGKGLTPAQQNELFQPFKRVNPSPQVEGTGLGLYIVKLLIERMGGEVHLRSEVGKGSTFTIELPDSPPPAQPEASPGSQTFV